MARPANRTPEHLSNRGTIWSYIQLPSTHAGGSGDDMQPPSWGHLGSLRPHSSPSFPFPFSAQFLSEGILLGGFHLLTSGLGERGGSGTPSIRCRSSIPGWRCVFGGWLELAWKFHHPLSAVIPSRIPSIIHKAEESCHASHRP
jgi:hypothetical protein